MYICKKLILKIEYSQYDGCQYYQTWYTRALQIVNAIDSSARCIDSAPHKDAVEVCKIMQAVSLHECF